MSSINAKTSCNSLAYVCEQQYLGRTMMQIRLARAFNGLLYGIF